MLCTIKRGMAVGIHRLQSGKDQEECSANPPEGTGRIQNPQRQTNPLAGKAFDLEGIDSHAVDPRLAPPAPRIDGTVAAGEMAELYWMAVCRDIQRFWK